MGIVVGEFNLYYQPMLSKEDFSCEPGLTGYSLCHNRTINNSALEMFQLSRFPPGKYYRVLHKCRNSNRHSETIVHESNLSLCSDAEQLHGEEWRNHLYLPVFPYIDKWVDHQQQSVESQMIGRKPASKMLHEQLILSEITKYWYKDIHAMLKERLV